MYKTFSSTVLLGIADPASPLSLLNQGEETSANYLKVIAAYLDVPVGNKLFSVSSRSGESNGVL